MKFVGFTDIWTAKGRLSAFAEKHLPNRRKLYWEGLDHHEFQDGTVVVGFPDNYVTWLENNVPNAATRLKDTWQEARNNPLGEPKCRLKA